VLLIRSHCCPCHHSHMMFCCYWRHFYSSFNLFSFHNQSIYDSLSIHPLLLLSCFDNNNLVVVIIIISHVALSSPCPKSSVGFPPVFSPQPDTALTHVAIYTSFLSSYVAYHAPQQCIICRREIVREKDELRNLRAQLDALCF
jgi:hypothetical protein